MKWYLLIVLLGSEMNSEIDPVEFPSEAECVAAGNAFIERFPMFDWLVPPDESSVIRPVLRSHVECVRGMDEFPSQT
ncbi:MAG: hypothetical protein ACREGL_03915 [Alphaproteobacteria bacterium]